MSHRLSAVCVSRRLALELSLQRGSKASHFDLRPKGDTSRNGDAEHEAHSVRRCCPRQPAQASEVDHGPHGLGGAGFLRVSLPSEVRCDQGLPARIIAVKPKFWLVGSIVIGKQKVARLSVA